MELVILSTLATVVILLAELSEQVAGARRRETAVRVLGAKRASVVDLGAGASRVHATPASTERFDRAA
ncbi:MAG: hypothetical protein JSR54_03235 [Proteobacteria bacterium]|nr:hypothetical protein [Pseudomonadota bacterium]